MTANGLGILVIGSGVRHVASSVVGHNRDVIANLLILRKTCLRIEGTANLNVGRPRCSTIGAK